MDPAPPERQPIGVRYQYLWAALTAIGTVALAVFGYVTLVRDSAPSTTTTSTSVFVAGVPQTTAAGPGPMGGGTVEVTTPAPPGPRLGRDVVPLGSEPCRAPNVASGGAWQLGPVGLSGRNHDTAYFCNLFSGGSGFIDFELARSYRGLEISLGFADGPGGTGHGVKFEIIGNDQEYLIEPRTLRFGDQADLTVNTTGVVRLRLKVTELSPAGGGGAASRPVLANLRLIRAD